MKNLMIKGTSVNIINSWLESINKKVVTDIDNHNPERLELDDETIVLLKILKDIFPDIISAESCYGKNPKDYCRSLIKDQVIAIKKVIAPFIS